MTFMLTTTSGSAGGTLEQTDPDASLGKYASTTLLDTSVTLHNLFDVVDYSEAIAGDTEYRCLAYYTEGERVVYIYSQTSSGATVSIAKETSLYGYSSATPFTTVANESTAPSPALTYTSTTGLAAGLVSGTMTAPNANVMPVWFKRVVGSSTAPKSTDSITLKASAGESGTVWYATTSTNTVTTDEGETTPEDYSGTYAANTLSLTSPSAAYSYISYGAGTSAVVLENRYWYSFPIMVAATLSGTLSCAVNVSWESSAQIRFLMGKRTAAGSESIIYTGGWTTLAVGVNTMSGTLGSTSFAIGDRLFFYIEAKDTRLSPGTFGFQTYGSNAVKFTLPASIIHVTSTTATYVLSWDIIGEVAKTADIKWDVAALMSKDADIQWNTLAAIEKTADIQWNVASNLLEVAQTADIQWHTQASVAQTADIQWNTQVGVMESMVDIELWADQYTRTEIFTSQHTEITLEEVA